MDSQTTQMVIDVLLGVCATLFGWLLRSVKESVKDLQENDKTLSDKVQKIELLVVGDYVRHEDFKDFSKEVLAKLDSIYNKMEKKADK